MPDLFASVVKSASPPLQQIPGKRDQTGKFVARVNVFFDDIKGEIIKPAKTPDRNHQQHGGPECRVVEKKQDGGGNADEEKQ